MRIPREKKGPFTKTEQNLLDKALIEMFKKDENYFNDNDLKCNSFSSRKKELPKNFWKDLTLFVPTRTTESIYDHVRRRLSLNNYKGKWSQADICKLKELTIIYGKKWSKIASNLNRLPGACYDKWRDALKNGKKRRKGKWNSEEKCKLIQLICVEIKHNLNQKIYIKNQIKWTFIANKLKSRSYLQCRNQWTRFFTLGSNVKLTPFDSYRIVNMLLSFGHTDETEIKWGYIIPGIPGHKIYNKWNSLCKKNFFLPLEKKILLIKSKLRCILQKYKKNQA